MHGAGGDAEQEAKHPRAASEKKQEGNQSEPDRSHLLSAC